MAETASQRLVRQMDETWEACKRYSQPVQYIVVPGFWFTRMRPSRRGRRLIKGRWRLSDRYRREIEPWLGREPHTVYVKDQPIIRDPQAYWRNNYEQQWPTNG